MKSASEWATQYYDLLQFKSGDRSINYEKFFAQIQADALREAARICDATAKSCSQLGAAGCECAAQVIRMEADEVEKI